MTNNQSEADRERCPLCGEWTSPSELTTHLREAHDQVELYEQAPEYYDEVYDDEPGDKSSNRANAETVSDDRPIEGGEPADPANAEPLPGVDDDLGDIDDVGHAPGEATLSQRDSIATLDKKWCMIGVGGAGNHLVDTLLMRRDTLREADDARKGVWEAGLGHYTLLNTNIRELLQTYHFREDRGFDKTEAQEKGIIGYGEHNYVGCGYRWQRGRDYMEADFEDEEPFNTKGRFDIDVPDLGEVQAVMLLHSVTKGTGSGATPVLAKYIKRRGLDTDRKTPTPIFSSIVIPSKGRYWDERGGLPMINGILGIARVSRQVEAIIPFDNDKLREVARSQVQLDIDGIDDHYPEHADANRAFAAFIEVVSMSSTANPEEAERLHAGAQFDIADTYLPAELLLERVPGMSAEDHAVVLAPVLGKSSASSFGEGQLEVLVANTIQNGRLARFDPTTAWGGTFVFFGPEEKLSDVIDLVDDGTFRDIVLAEQYLDGEEMVGPWGVDVEPHTVIVPTLDDVFLWGTLWNPQMDSLDRMYERFREFDEGDWTPFEGMDRIRTQIDSLMGKLLGRENMKG